MTWVQGGGAGQTGTGGSGRLRRAWFDLTPRADSRSEALRQIARKSLYAVASNIYVSPDPAGKRNALAQALVGWGRWVPRRRRRSWRWNVAGILGLVLALGLAGLASAQSSRSVPGEPLWNLKRAKESTAQWLARGPRAEAEAALASTEERLRETHRLVGEGRFEEARKALGLFYDEFEYVRWRLRGTLPETDPDLFARADAQLQEAAALDERLNGPRSQSAPPKGPESVGTLTPTPRPPWEPEHPQEPD